MRAVAKASHTKNHLTAAIIGWPGLFGGASRIVCATAQLGQQLARRGAVATLARLARLITKPQKLSNLGASPYATEISTVHSTVPRSALL